jgi:hypothetical protein
LVTNPQHITISIRSGDDHPVITMRCWCGESQEMDQREPIVPMLQDFNMRHLECSNPNAAALLQKQVNALKGQLDDFARRA